MWLEDRESRSSRQTTKAPKGRRRSGRGVDDPHLPPSLRWRAAAYVASGVLLGAAFLDPGLALAAWLGMAVLATALLWSSSVVEVAVGVLASQFVMRAVGLSWVPAMNAITFPFEGATALLLLTLQWLFAAAATTGSLTLAHTLVNRAPLRRFAFVWLWLPLAWSLGELGRFHLLSLAIDDWLVTQWAVQPVLRMLGAIGWYPTLWICIAAAASAGEAIARRQPRVALAGLPAVLCWVCMPPLASKMDALAGVAAIHTNSRLEMPHGNIAAESPQLVVWPEDAIDLRPLLQEGATPGARLPKLLEGSSATHLLGLVTSKPLGGVQNQLVAVASDGRVEVSRAKRLLFPIHERKLAGWGHDYLVPGRASSLMNVAQRNVVALICGELMDRRLVAEGVAAGGELMVVAARDQMMPTPQALRMLLAVQVLRSVEFGVPSARSSFGGWAYFVSAAGEVLALSGRDHNGVLFWDRERGARDVDFWGEPIEPGRPIPQRPPPDVAVLYARQAPGLRMRCPEGRCSYHEVEQMRCEQRPHKVVVIAGHAQGRASRYLSLEPERVAELAACFSPELVVLDVCYGASYPLLHALADEPTRVVAAPFLLPASGLEYGPAFFDAPDLDTRVAAITTGAGAGLLRGWVTRAGLASVAQEVAAMSSEELTSRLVRRNPNQVRMEVDGLGPVLFTVDRHVRPRSRKNAARP